MMNNEERKIFKKFILDNHETLTSIEIHIELNKMGIPCTHSNVRDFKRYKKLICKKTKSKPIGYEFLDSRGNIMVKYKNDPLSKSKNYKSKQRYLYENHHNISLAKNENIIFKDGDKTNLDINNLGLIKSSEMAKLNRVSGLKKDSPFRYTMILINRIEQLIKEREK